MNNDLINYVYPNGNIDSDFFLNMENIGKIYNRNLNLKYEENAKMNDNEL